MLSTRHFAAGVDPRLLGYLLHVDECVSDWSLPETPEAPAEEVFDLTEEPDPIPSSVVATD
jgi:hypothetical protein